MLNSSARAGTTISLFRVPPPPPTAPGAHDAGIEYGENAPEIAADNMAAHIAAKHEVFSPCSENMAAHIAAGPGPRYTPADDKQRAFDALVDHGMRDALRQRARTLLSANPCFLRALQMVEISTVDPELQVHQRLWIHVVLQGYKQRVSHRVLNVLQGSDFGRGEWCLPNKSLLMNDGIEHNVECFRHVMSQAGLDYEEIPSRELRPVLLPHASVEANQMIMTLTESELSTKTDDLLEWDIDQLWRVVQSLLDDATPDEGSYRSLSVVNQAPTSRERAREEFAARLARVRTELANHLPTLHALDEE